MALEPIAKTVSYHSEAANPAKTRTAEILKDEEQSVDNTEQPQPGNPDKLQITDAIAKANELMKQKRTRCEFSYSEEINRVMIKVYNRDSEEVIREIPPEDTIKIIENIWEIAGLIVDKRI